MRRALLVIGVLLALVLSVGCSSEPTYRDAYLRGYDAGPFVKAFEDAAKAAEKELDAEFTVIWNEGWNDGKTPNADLLNEGKTAVTMLFKRAQDDWSYTLYFYLVYDPDNNLLTAAGVYDDSTGKLQSGSEAEKILLATLNAE